MKIDEKIALITGGGAGLGRELAKGFARAGAHVVIADIDAVQRKAWPLWCARRADTPGPCWSTCATTNRSRHSWPRLSRSAAPTSL